MAIRSSRGWTRGKQPRAGDQCVDYVELTGGEVPDVKSLMTPKRYRSVRFGHPSHVRLSSRSSVIETQRTSFQLNR